MRGGDPAGLLIQVQVKGLAIILQLKGDHPFCLEINEEPTAIITMHLMMLLLPWHAMEKLIIQSHQIHVNAPRVIATVTECAVLQ